jgi:hypothetical protein
VPSTLTVTERRLQATVIEMCKVYGIAWYHTFDSRRSNRGWPDLALCGSRGFITRELKSGRGVTTPDQEDWGARLRQAGVNWGVWRPADLNSGRIERELLDIR